MHYRRQYTNKAELLFHRHELLDDIRQYAYVEGDIMDAKDEHAKHQVFDIGERGNIDLVTRVLRLACSECVEALYPFSKRVVESEETRDDTLVTDRIYKIELLVPDNFSKTTLDLMERYIHEFMIYRVLEHWFSITKPAASANWKQKAEDAKHDLESSKSIRMTKVRKGMSPF